MTRIRFVYQKVPVSSLCVCVSRVDSLWNNSRLQMWFQNLISFTAIGCECNCCHFCNFDSLNLVSCLLGTNSSQEYDRSRACSSTLFNFRRNGNKRWIPTAFHVYSRYSRCYERCSPDRDRMHMTYCFCYDAIRERTPPGSDIKVTGSAQDRPSRTQEASQELCCCSPDGSRQ